jgi:hypothetical protein
MTSSQDLVDDAVRRYDVAAAEGQRLISRHWPALLEETRQACVRSGFYSPRGERQEVEFARGNAPEDDLPRLEYSLGVLRLCVGAKLPFRSEVGAPIPREARNQEVLGCCEDLLSVRAWHDPNFLRLGLHAVRTHQMANALSMLEPEVKLTNKLVGTFFGLAFMVLMPAAFAVGVSAAVKEELLLSILAFYVAAGGVLAAMSAAKVGVSEPVFEREYSAWSLFESLRSAGVVGSGALEHLRQIASRGVKVPSIAFDMADALRWRTLGSTHTKNHSEAA